MLSLCSSRHHCAVSYYIVAQIVFNTFNSNASALAERVGVARALELTLLGEVWSSKEAHLFGLVTKVAGPDVSVTTTALDIAEQLSTAPPSALSSGKATLRAIATLGCEDHLAHHDLNLDLLQL